MSLFTKIITIALTLYLSGSFALKHLDEKAALETKISFEKKEKTDSESEDLKLAFTEGNSLALNKNIKLIPFEEKVHFTDFTPSVPTSPPNS